MRINEPSQAYTICLISMSLEKADKAELVGSAVGITKTKPFTNFLRDCNPQATEWSLKARGHKISCKFINGVLDMPKAKPQVQYLTVLSQAQRYRLCYTLASLITTEEASGPLYHKVMRAGFDVMVKEYKVSRSLLLWFLRNPKSAIKGDEKLPHCFRLCRESSE